MSRRAADMAVAAGRVALNGTVAVAGAGVTEGDTVQLDNVRLQLPVYRTIMLHKPVGYVTSRRQQGTAPTVYELLPDKLHDLKPVGRLDKDSSGLLLLTNNGRLAQELQHPSRGKWKRYSVELDRPLEGADRRRLTAGIKLKDGISRLRLSGGGRSLIVQLQEGRNRQIRRSFAAAGYSVKKLHRTTFGRVLLGDLAAGKWRELTDEEIGDGE